MVLKLFYRNSGVGLSVGFILNETSHLQRPDSLKEWRNIYEKVWPLFIICGLPEGIWLAECRFEAGFDPRAPSFIVWHPKHFAALLLSL